MATVPVLQKGPEREALREPFESPFVRAEDVGLREGAAIKDIAAQLERLRREKDASSALSAKAKFDDEMRVFLDAPETGIRSRKGSDADGIHNETDDFIGITKDKYAKTLTNSSQIKSFEGLVRQSRNSTLNNVMRQEADQLKVFKNEAVAATLKSQLEYAAGAPDDEQIIEDSLNNSEVAIRAGSAGLPAQTIENRIKTNRSAIHTKVTFALADKSALQAEEYFKKNKDSFIDDDRKKVGAALEDAVRLQKVQIKADEIISKGGNLEDWLKDAKSIKNSEIRRDVTASLEHEFNVQEGIRKENERQVFNDQQAIVEDGGRPNPMAIQNPSQRSYLESRAKHLERKRVDPTYDVITDIDKWGEWSAKTEAQVIEMSLEELTVGYRNSMDTAHWESVLNEWEATMAKHGRGTMSAQHAATLTFKDISLAAARDAGVVPQKKTRTKWRNKEAERYDRFTRELDSRVRQHEESTGRKASTEDMKKLADEMVLNNVYIEKLFTDPQRPVSVIDPENRERAYVPINEATDDENRMLGQLEEAKGIVIANDKKERLLASFRMQDTALRDSILGEIE